MSYTGIDYGRLTAANRNIETNIHYGVISHNECTEAFYDSVEPQYYVCCPYCGAELKKKFEARRCPKCYKKLEESDFYDTEADIYLIDNKEYFAVRHSDYDIFIERSPYYTLCSFCSPCAPGAGYIMNQNSEGIKAYCFGHDFFPENKAPYKIYSVETNEEILP